MSNKTETPATLEPLISRVAREFTRGVSLIEGLTDEVYAGSPDDVGNIGAHFRHNVDFVSNLLSGLETGKIDYSARERDIRVENDRAYAIGKIKGLMARLRALDAEEPGRSVLIRSEIDERVWHGSTAARELEFLHSHTVHHYALIVEKLKSFGLEADGSFGVAPSTLRFWEAGKETASV